jgi:hypothetical protein
MRTLTFSKGDYRLISNEILVGKPTYTSDDGDDGRGSSRQTLSEVLGPVDRRVSLHLCRRSHCEMFVGCAHMAHVRSGLTKVYPNCCRSLTTGLGWVDVGR